MTILKSMVANTAARSATEIVNRLGAAIFWIFIARYLGPSGLGSLAFALSLYNLFSAISTLGLNAVVIRDVSRDHSKAGQYFGHTMILGFISSIVFAGLMILTAKLIHPGKDTLFITILLAIVIVPTSGFIWSRAILSAAEKMGYIAIAKSAENIFKVTLGVFFLLNGYGIRTIALIVAASKIVSFAICYFYANTQVVRPQWKIQHSLIKYFIRQVPSFSMIAIFNALFWALTVILLTKLKGETEAGLYSVAFKFVDICISFAAAYGGALFPVSSRILKTNPDMFEKLFKKSIKYILIFTIAIATGTNILAPNLIHWLFGPGMHDAIPVLQVLIWLIVPFSFIPVFAYSLINNHLQNRDLTANFLATASVLLFNLILIPQLHALGAAIATLAGCVVFFTVEFYWVEKELLRLKFSAEMLKPIFGAALMSVAVITLKNIHPVLAVLAGGSIYIGFLWFSHTITTHEIALLKQLRSN
ncbi:MAG: flippase [Calditrichaeota bacterium]|nr:flippase [Calditrichota bacterium]